MKSRGLLEGKALSAAGGSVQREFCDLTTHLEERT